MRARALLSLRFKGNPRISQNKRFRKKPNMQKNKCDVAQLLGSLLATVASILAQKQQQNKNQQKERQKQRQIQNPRKYRRHQPGTDFRQRPKGARAVKFWPPISGRSGQISDEDPNANGDPTMRSLADCADLLGGL